LAAVPSIGRAARFERQGAAGAEATQSLYERFAGQIYGYCLHQLGSREEAEDAVQTTFMNAFRGLQRGIVPEIESAWLFKIAHNVCLSRRRSSWRRGRVESPNNMEVLQEVVPARETDDVDLIRLQDVLEGMPESQRRAILLREWQGLSYREIGEILGLTQAAVETLIFRARRTLAAGLEEAPPVEERRAWGKRARHGLDAGGLIAALKTLLATGATAKVAATAAVIATTAVVAATATHDHPALRPSHSTHAAAHATHIAAAPLVVTSVPTRHVSRAPIVVAASSPQRHVTTHRAPTGPAVSHAVAPAPVTPTRTQTPIVQAPAPVASSAPPGHAKHARTQKVHPAKPLRVVEATHESSPGAQSPPADHGQATARGQQNKAGDPGNSDQSRGNAHK
jgi:RNA polymerase sigma factor (sigma-70 family)